jgi:hypothetical protein
VWRRKADLNSRNSSEFNAPHRRVASDNQLPTGLEFLDNPEREHNLTQLLRHTRLFLSRIAHERSGLRKGRIMRRVTGKSRVQIALVGRRFLLASKFPHKRRNAPLNSHSVIGLTRILLLMS